MKADDEQMTLSLFALKSVMLSQGTIIPFSSTLDNDQSSRLGKVFPKKLKV